MRQHTKTLGQVFLHDKNIINKIIKFASPNKTDTIIEIGCGKGILSKSLAEICNSLHVIEIDERWLDHVKAMNLNNIKFHHQDILKFNLANIGKAKIIANIPYQITTPIIDHFTKFKSELTSITIMIQKEVAERILARENSKTYGLLTLFCNYHFTVSKGFNVSRDCFSPKPNVDSTVIQLIPKKGCIPNDEEDLFFAMLKSLFWGRRKKIITCLLKGPYIKAKPEIKHLIPEIMNKRAEQLSLIEHISLFETIKNTLEYQS